MKPILCFLVGYIPDINDTNVKNTYGSEISLLNLSIEFSKKYDVYIFGENFNEAIKNNINYKNYRDFKDFQEQNHIDILILLRYIHYFLDIDLELNISKVYLWLQDIFPFAFFNNIELIDHGKFLMKNIIDRVNSIISLSNWHKEFLSNFYQIDPNKIITIGNAININKFKANIKKQKNRFIWTSHGGRGIHKMIEYFHDIKRKLPDAELYIFRDRTAFSQEILEEMNKYNYIIYGDKLQNDDVILEFQKSDIWFYPTDFDETYCISALEAQMSKCVCIATSRAALKETIGDRGILINEPIWSEEYKEKCIEEIIKISNNEELKEKYQNMGYSWAIQQTWEKRAEEWYELFRK